MATRLLDKVLERRNISKDEIRDLKEIPDYNIKNMNEAVDLYIDCLCRKNKIGILFDVDVDGLSAGKIVFEYTQRFTNNIFYFMNKNKKHGLNDNVLNWVKSKNINLIIIVDSGTNDYLLKDKLSEEGVSVIVLDHHEIENYSYLDLKENVVTVNCNYEGSPNRELSGAGVTFRFIREVDKRLKTHDIDRFKSWVGLSVLSDSCSMLNKENRYYVSYLYSNYNKDTLFNKFTNYGSLKNMFNFTVIPILNACIRMGEENLAIDIVLSKNDRKIKKMLENAKIVYENQKYSIEEAIKLISIVEGKNIIVGKIPDNEDFTNIAGLIANRLKNKTKKSCMIIKKDDIKNSYTGSFRAEGEFNSDILNKFGIKTAGHKEACGIEINKEKFKDTMINLLNYEYQNNKNNNYDIEVYEEDYPFLERELFEIAEFNEMTGKHLEEINIKIYGINYYPDTYVYPKVIRHKYKYFEVVDFDLDKEKNNNFKSYVVASPCLNRGNFTLIKK